MNVEAPSPRPENIAEQAYDAIAPVYDDFTAHHDYGVWLGSLMTALRRHGLRGNRLLDVACGTGKSFLPMLDDGWEVVGCDVSAAMLELARAKAGDRARLLVADMRELPQLGEFDLAWVLDDAVNYLLSGEELEAALSGLRRNLAPHGLLLFDVNTITSYRTFFAREEAVERGGRRLVWHGMTPTDVEFGSICEARFEEQTEDGTPVGTHIHRQRHFPEPDVRAAMRGAGLECVGVYGHGLDGLLDDERPLDELVHTKAVYVARRAG